MGQGDVYDLLKQHPNKWFTSEEIYNKITHISRGSLCISINRLVKGRVVDRKMTKVLKPNRNRKYIQQIKYKDDDWRNYKRIWVRNNTDDTQ